MGILINHYQNQMDTLTEGELYAFTSLDNRPELLTTLSLSKLAEHVASSNSTIIRLTQKLGFEGFSDFRYAIKNLLNTMDKAENDGLVQQYQHFFNTILPAISPDKFHYFAEKIHHAKNIFIVGLGLTKPISEYMSKHIYQLDCNAVYVYESHMLDLLPNLLQRGDLVIFISESGETMSLIHCAKKTAHTGATLLSITNSAHNTLNHSMQMSLTTQMPRSFHHNYDTTSRVFQAAVIDVILETYANKYLKQ